MTRPDAAAAMARLVAVGVVGGVAMAVPPSLQLAAAGLALGVVGMAHGAGDLQAVPRSRWSSFLLAYAAIGILSLAVWIWCPAVALPLFLVASAVHFGGEDAPVGVAAAGRAAHGALLVATPAVLHHATMVALLTTVSGNASVAGVTTGVMVGAGTVGAAALSIDAIIRRDERLLAGTAALLLFPPLVGFSTGFLLLHAGPQTRARASAMGRSTLSYLRLVAPVFGAAVVLFAVIGFTMLRLEPTGYRALFAATAALAMPHLVIMPWFERRGIADPASAPRSTWAVSAV